MGSDEEASPQEELDEAAAYKVRLAQLVEILRRALAEELERTRRSEPKMADDQRGGFWSTVPGGITGGRAIDGDCGRGSASSDLRLNPIKVVKG
jgi:hypothetical protein